MLSMDISYRWVFLDATFSRVFSKLLVYKKFSAVVYWLVYPPVTRMTRVQFAAGIFFCHSKNPSLSVLSMENGASDKINAGGMQQSDQKKNKYSESNFNNGNNGNKPMQNNISYMNSKNKKKKRLQKTKMSTTTTTTTAKTTATSTATKQDVPSAIT